MPDSLFAVPICAKEQKPVVTVVLVWGAFIEPTAAGRRICLSKRAEKLVKLVLLAPPAFIAALRWDQIFALDLYIC